MLAIFKISKENISNLKIKTRNMSEKYVVLESYIFTNNGILVQLLHMRVIAC